MSFIPESTINEQLIRKNSKPSNDALSHSASFANHHQNVSIPLSYFTNTQDGQLVLPRGFVLRNQQPFINNSHYPSSVHSTLPSSLQLSETANPLCPSVNTDICHPSLLSSNHDEEPPDRLDTRTKTNISSSNLTTSHESGVHYKMNHQVIFCSFFFFCLI